MGRITTWSFATDTLRACHRRYFLTRRTPAQCGTMTTSHTRKHGGSAKFRSDKRSRPARRWLSHHSQVTTSPLLETTFFVARCLGEDLASPGSIDECRILCYLVLRDQVFLPRPSAVEHVERKPKEPIWLSINVTRVCLPLVPSRCGPSL